MVDYRVDSDIWVWEHQSDRHLVAGRNGHVVDGLRLALGCNRRMPLHP